MPFSARIIVRFGDTDPAGLVYYPRIFHYFHVAMEEFFVARCGTSYERLMSAARIGFPTVKAEAEFLVPLVYGDELDVEVFVSQVGLSSATFEYRILRGSEPTLCVRASLVQVAMNLDERRAVPIPENLRRAFEQSPT